VRVRAGAIEVVDLFELSDFLQRFPLEWRLSFENVENDSFQQVAEGYIVIFGKTPSLPKSQ
jgi:hypothetical protein